MATCIPIRIPGPQGPAGANGTNGTDGYNAFSIVAVAFNIPAQQATVLVTLTDPPGNRWMALGQIVAVQSAGATGVGFYRVQSKAGTNQATLLNLRDDTTDEYLGNIDGAGVVAVGLWIAPAGVQGPPGTAGTSGAPDDAEYIVTTADPSLPNAVPLDGVSAGLLYNNAGGVLSSLPEGTGDGEIPLVDDPGGLTSGDVMFATGSGVETKADAAARTALGLGTMATQDANNVAITGGTISNVTVPGPTAIFPKDYLLFQHQLATTVNSGTFTQGSWVTVPLNVEVADTGGYGTLAANVMSLAAGTYRARWKVPGLQVDSFQSRLYNVSTAAVIAYGSNAEAASTDATTAYSFGEFRFTLGVAQQVRIEAQCQLTNATTGFGAANSFGGTEVYSSIEFEREAS